MLPRRCGVRFRHDPYGGVNPATKLPPPIPPPLLHASSHINLLPPPLYRPASAATLEWIAIGNLSVFAADVHLLCTLLRAVAQSINILAGYPCTQRTNGETRNTGLWFVLVSTADAARLRAYVAGRVVCHAIEGQAATDLTYCVFTDAADASAYSDPKSPAASHARHRGQLRLPPVTVEPLKGPIPQYVIDAQAAQDATAAPDAALAMTDAPMSNSQLAMAAQDSKDRRRQLTAEG